MISCGNIASMTLSYFVDVDEVKPDDAILYAAPMSHGAGLYNFMHVLRAARHVVPESGGFDADEVLRLAPEIGNVSMFAAPTMVRRLVDAAKAMGSTGDGLRTVVYAGGPMYEADILEAVEVMGPRFVQIYGQGECPMGMTALSRQDVADRSHPRWRERLNSVGRAQCVVAVAILDAEGRELPPGEVGEIAVRGILENPEQRLQPGMFATVHLLLSAAESVITLPRTAVSFFAYGESVFTIDEVDGELRVQRQPIRVGRTRGQQVEILSGLVAGQRVVHTGHLKLRDGQRVVTNAGIPLPTDIEDG